MDWSGIAAEARTLQGAHEALSRARPRPDADLSAWRAFYERSASVYATIAETDRGHHHEALYWAARERTKAEEIEQRLENGYARSTR
jgi:hypothetical protein